MESEVLSLDITKFRCIVLADHCYQLLHLSALQSGASVYRKTNMCVQFVSSSNMRLSLHFGSHNLAEHEILDGIPVPVSDVVEQLGGKKLESSANEYRK